MKKVRVNIDVRVNSSRITRMRRNGRDLIVVPSATLPDDVVMNRVKYPAAEIEKGYKSLNRTPAPLGHPTYNGGWISARDPEAINMSYVGAWNENVRRENGRVFLDKIIDVDVANRTEGGKALLEAIKNGDVLHTSTGLLCMLDEEEDEDYDFVARDLEFDHDAILMGERGAATPEQGVGLLVNAAKGDDIPVINSALEYAESELDWAGLRLIEALERTEKASVWEKVKAAIMEAIKPAARDNETKKGDEEMDVTKAMFDELSGKVNAIAAQLDSDALVKAIADAVTNAVKPLTERLNKELADTQAKEDAEKNDLVSQVTKANLLGEDAAKAMPLVALRELVANTKPKGAARINGAFTPRSTDVKSGYKLPKGD